MLLGYDYPLLGLFWTIAILSFWVTIVFSVIWAFVDNFRRHDHSGWAKAGWMLVIIVLPLLGTVVYLIARPAEIDLARFQLVRNPALRWPPWSADARCHASRP